jgi:hypothetical protein
MKENHNAFQNISELISIATDDHSPRLLVLETNKTDSKTLFYNSTKERIHILRLFSELKSLESSRNNSFFLPLVTRR